MLKPVLGLTATGIVAILAWKLVLPLVAVVVGLALFVLKVVFIAALVCFAIWLVRRLNRSRTEQTA